MKPFTFLTIVLGLILGFLYAASHATHVTHPAVPPSTLVLLDTRRIGPDGRPIGARSTVELDEGGREAAEGLPVPIVPGTRVTEAEIRPPRGARVGRPAPAPVRREAPERLVTVYPSYPSTTRSISGRLSATADRARNDARLQLEREVAEWLAPEVPTHWKPPAHLVNRLIRKTEVHPIEKEYGTVYEATLVADFSTESRGAFLAAYHREVVARRLTILGGIIGFVLACLAALAGYIRADEATKGYYTHWLRAIAAAGVGASGVLFYQILG